MKTQVILVDWENVQPELLPALNMEGARVLVFIGPHQNKLPFATVQAVQMLGERAQYVQVSQPGKNALDMHIAFYMGKLTAELPDVCFHVISKDRDYDALIAHLRALNLHASKWPELASIPGLKLAPVATLKNLVSVAQDWLSARKANRPKTLKALINSLKISAFASGLSDEEVSALVERLAKDQLISITGKKVEYPNPQS